MTPRAWILRAVSIFPATRRGLEALAEHHGAPQPRKLVNDMIKAGELAVYGVRKHARWGKPGLKLRRR